MIPYHEIESDSEEEALDSGDFGSDSKASIFGWHKYEAKPMASSSEIAADDPMRAVKVEIKSLLVAGKMMTADCLERDYQMLYGYSIQYARFGCNTIDELLERMPDVCTRYMDATGHTTYMPKTDEKHKELQYFIRRQLSPITSPSKRNNRQPCSNGPPRGSPVKSSDSPPQSNFRFRAPWLKDRVASTKSIGQFPCAPVTNNRITFNDEGPKCRSRCQTIAKMVQDIGEKSPDKTEARCNIETLKNYYYQQTGLSIWGKIMTIEEYAKAWSDPQYSIFWRITKEKSSSGDDNYYMIVPSRQSAPAVTPNATADRSATNDVRASISLPSNISMNSCSKISTTKLPGLDSRQISSPGLNMFQNASLTNNLPPDLNVQKNDSDISASSTSLGSVSSAVEKKYTEAELKKQCLTIANIIRALGDRSPDDTEARLSIDKLCKTYYHHVGSNIWWKKMTKNEYAETWSDESFYHYWRILVEQGEDGIIYYVVVPTDETKNYLHLVGSPENSKLEAENKSADSSPNSSRSQFDVQLEILNEELNNIQIAKEEVTLKTDSNGYRDSPRLSNSGLRIINHHVKAAVSYNNRHRPMKPNDSFAKQDVSKSLLNPSNNTSDTSADVIIKSIPSIDSISSSSCSSLGSVDIGEEQKQAEEEAPTKEFKAKQLRFAAEDQVYAISDVEIEELNASISCGSDISSSGESSLLIHEEDSTSRENIGLRYESLENNQQDDLTEPYSSLKLLLKAITSKIVNPAERRCILHKLLSLLYMIQGTISDINLEKLTENIKSTLEQDDNS